MNRSSVYKEISISTSSPTNLVVLLYQGALRFLREAVDDIKRQDYVHKRQSIDRAAAIVHYLQATLDTEKGQEIARELNRLYTYMTTRIYEGSTKLDCKPLEEVIKLLETLLSGWEQIAQKEQKHAVSADLMTQQASGERFEIQA
jgi:flagellar secretion chaperone FliS